MHVIGTVGLPGSGKGEAAKVAREEDIPVVTMGDVIRRACRNRGRDPDTEHGAVAVELREEDGDDAIAERSLPMIRDRLSTADTVLVDGIRGGVEVDRFQEAFGDAFVLIEIAAPFGTRVERIDLRGRDTSADPERILRERDERERGFGMAAAMDRADLTVDNDGSLEAFRDRIREVLRDPEGVVTRGGPS
ncbi:hypothetical protein BRD17_06190 [Halobacteriales archaeon SW_7_68_16]|nr:MAG: hypothetical protein BRD17_06190 [Halobacteriales archaeon SW_7_68_16]